MVVRSENYGCYSAWWTTSSRHRDSRLMGMSRTIGRSGYKCSLCTWKRRNPRAKQTPQKSPCFSRAWVPTAWEGLISLHFPQTRTKISTTRLWISLQVNLVGRNVWFSIGSNFGNTSGLIIRALMTLLLNCEPWVINVILWMQNTKTFWETKLCFQLEINVYRSVCYARRTCLMIVQSRFVTLLRWLIVSCSPCLSRVVRHSRGLSMRWWNMGESHNHIVNRRPGTRLARRVRSQEPARFIRHVAAHRTWHHTHNSHRPKGSVGVAVTATATTCSLIALLGVTCVTVARDRIIFVNFVALRLYIPYKLTLSLRMIIFWDHWNVKWAVFTGMIIVERGLKLCKSRVPIFAWKLIRVPKRTQFLWKHGSKLLIGPIWHHHGLLYVHLVGLLFRMRVLPRSSSVSMVTMLTLRYLSHLTKQCPS